MSNRAFRHVIDIRQIEMLEDGRACVVIELDCGCQVARTIDASRVIADAETGETFVAGKFVCEKHAEPESGAH